MEAHAWLILPGHPDGRAEVRVRRYPFWARVWRTAGLGALWGAITVVAFFVTIFDPFLSSIPAIVGAATVWRSWRGEYRVQRFRGDCPRCSEALLLREGACIGTPHKLVCYRCHHEPFLALV